MSAGQIRRYRPDDLERLKEITVICFAEVSIDRNIESEFGLVGGRDWQWRKQRHIDADVAGDNARGVLVCELEGEVVGYITTRLDEESGIGWIPNMAVDPAHQEKGIGRDLLQASLDFMRERGMECAKIETLEQNEVGSRFYPSAGFREVGRQIHYLMRL